ncbi:MAG TPA: twin transmembrane helix small protein [Luteimonas sp.]|jgi:succinate dehydrogenase/fumarate reductase cytochrome b subunit|nr:twin transmembrane helix small protein [Luteimonas sp.]
MKTLLIVGFLGVIVYHLGAGLYYMLVDKGATTRTVNALTRRIGFSVLLVLLVAAGIAGGLIQPHGVGS